MNFIKSFYLALLFFSSSLSYSQTKVLVALYTTESDEPHLVESFIAGYESSGGKWKGIIKIDTGILADEMYTKVMPYCYEKGFDLVLRNTGPGYYLNIVLDTSYNNGIQIVSGTGSNRFHGMSAGTYPMPHAILCGAGDTMNMTGYYCEFYDVHPFSHYPITSLTQSGDTLIVAVDIKTNGGFVIPPEFMVNISGVTGYSNNPNGLKTVTGFVEDSQYNKFKIQHKLGKGSLNAGSIVEMYWQSYSHAYIAGKLAFIKDSLKCSWWEARYRMRMTSSNKGAFDKYNGYGKPDVAAALAYDGEIIENPFQKLGSMDGEFEAKRSGNKIIVKFDIVANALKYNFYDNGKLIGTVKLGSRFSSTNNAEFKISSSDPSPHVIWYVAVRDDQISGESKRITIE